MKARIHVMPKKTVLDPQGKAVANAIRQLGMDCIQEARVGRYIEIDVAGQNAELTRQKLEGICKDLLSNPVVEDYRLEMD